MRSERWTLEDQLCKGGWHLRGEGYEDSAIFEGVGHWGKSAEGMREEAAGGQIMCCGTVFKQ